MHSPVGTLTLFEDQDALVALDWGWVEGGTETPLLEAARQQLEDYFAGQRQDFALPLAPHGTAFQQKVWTAMAAIPYGQTRTYGQLAGLLGTAPRAVGGACGRNPLPIIVPCHRVLAAQGRLGGYSGLDGLESKRFLLTLEGWTAAS